MNTSRFPTSFPVPPSLLVCDSRRRTVSYRRPPSGFAAPSKYARRVVPSHICSPSSSLPPPSCRSHLKKEKLHRARVISTGLGDCRVLAPLVCSVWAELLGGHHCMKSSPSPPRDGGYRSLQRGVTHGANQTSFGTGHPFLLLLHPRPRPLSTRQATRRLHAAGKPSSALIVLLLCTHRSLATYRTILANVSHFTGVEHSYPKRGRAVTIPASSDRACFSHLAPLAFSPMNARLQAGQWPYSRARSPYFKQKHKTETGSPSHGRMRAGHAWKEAGVAMS